MFTPVVDRIEYGGTLLDGSEQKAIMEVINAQGGRRWTIGENSVALEKELAEFFGVKKAVLTNSGSSALLVAMTALKLPQGSKVIVPAVNFPTAYNSILQCGHIPFVVDVDIKTLNIDLERVKIAMELHPDIKAVIAVHIAGNPVDMKKLREIVGEEVKIISDNCDGSGSTYIDNNSEDWKAETYIDQYADISCISMHAAHIISMGEGGACLTNDQTLGERCFKLREWGRAGGTDKIYKYEGFPDDYKERYVYEEIGFNMKPLELQCAMGRIQLKKLQKFKEARRINHELLTEQFKNNSNFTLTETMDYCSPCWFSFALLCNVPRKQVMAKFEENNIECRTIFSGNIIRHPAYKDTPMYVMEPLKNADDIMKRGMFLSCHPSITKEMIEFIGKVGRSI